MFYVAGVDEIASETRKSEGWTYFAIPDDAAAEFTKEAARILSQTKMDAFHGKEFKKKFVGEYEMFLRLIRAHLEKFPDSFLATTLLDETWKAEYVGFVDRTIGAVIGGAGIDSPELVEATKMLAKPLFAFQRLTCEFPEGDLVRFEIDEHAVTCGLATLQPSKNGIAFSSLMPLEIIYRGYREHRFRHAPAIVRGSTKILPDQQSFIVQAADLVGNLSVCYARDRMGQQSKTNTGKVTLFERVFGDILDKSFHFNANLELIGTELALKHNGSWTFRIGSEPLPTENALGNASD